MACVHYSLQQITKDSDWIIPAEDLPGCGSRPRVWRASYRKRLDSADDGHTITYAAYPNENPVFSSGLVINVINGWRKEGEFC